MNLQGHCTHLCKTRYKLTKIMPLEKRKQYPHTNHRRPLGLKSDGDPLYEHLKMGSLRSPSLCQKKRRRENHTRHSCSYQFIVDMARGGIIAFVVLLRNSDSKMGCIMLMQCFKVVISSKCTRYNYEVYRIQMKSS
jgi:hypothetical protein